MSVLQELISEAIPSQKYHKIICLDSQWAFEAEE
jgi:hypothetical protein